MPFLSFSPYVMGYHQGRDVCLDWFLRGLHIALFTSALILVVHSRCGWSVKRDAVDKGVQVDRCGL